MTPHDPKLLQELGDERTERRAGRLTLRQIEAIANETRLPGEIACAYGVSAAVILRIQQNVRIAKSRREATVRQQGTTSRAFLIAMLLALGCEAIA